MFLLQFAIKNVKIKIYRNIFSDSIKCRENFSLAEDLLASQEGLCSMELISHFVGSYLIR
jgi:hypothetical protein